MNIRRILLALIASGLVYSGTAIAQDDDDHGLINVFMSQVKPGKVPEYLELLSELAESRKAAGLSGVDVWQVIRGQGGRIYSVTGWDNYADLGQPFDSRHGLGLPGRRGRSDLRCGDPVDCFAPFRLPRSSQASRLDLRPSISMGGNGHGSDARSVWPQVRDRRR